MPRRAPFLLFAGLLCLVMLSVACGDPPTREMDQAQGAIDAARAAGADKYATEEYGAAVNALKSAQQAVTDRDYRLALNHALDSRDRAQAAAKLAAEQRATQRSAAERRLGEVTAQLAQANQRYAVAAQGTRIPRRTLAPVRSAIDAADVSLQKAGTQITEGDYLGSQQQLSDAAAQLRAVSSQIDGLVEGRGGRAGRGRH